MSGQVVDTLTAEEFMQQVLQQVSHDELRAIGAGCDRKSALFRDVLLARPLTDDALASLFPHIFRMRRRAGELAAAAGGSLAPAIERLLDDPGPVSERFDAFVDAFPGHQGTAQDLAGEMLHFTQPESFWLWTRWMWDPRTETGSLRLVTMDEFDLYADTPGATYLRVGEAVAFVDQTGHAVGFTDLGGGPFGIDVFLACVYGIYMYTVLRMRMTQEFNHVVPELPELARRLLGVYRMED